MHRWVPLDLPKPHDNSSVHRIVNTLTGADCNLALYYTPQRGWWGAVTAGDAGPEDKPRLYGIMDSQGNMRTVSTDVILRCADVIREGFPSET